MPDISMCSNDKCPLREECYRFKATPSEYQSYANLEYNENDQTCEWFWEIEKDEHRKK